MSLNQAHINYKEFIANEMKTLGFVQGFAPLKTSFPNLVEECYKYFFLNKGKNALHRDALKFNCYLDLEIENQNSKVILGCDLSPSYSLATYSLSICRQKEDNSHEILRKFHFDYEPTYSEIAPKPVYHLQYGGKLNDGLDSLGVSIETIHPWLSVPRINCTPMNFALLLDLVFCEFPSEITSRIREDNRWRGLIKNNEDIILVGYYKQIHQFLTGNHYRSSKLLRDYQYGS